MLQKMGGFKFDQNEQPFVVNTKSDKTSRMDENVL